MQFLKSIFLYSIKSRWFFLLLFLAATAILIFDLYSLLPLKDLSSIKDIRKNLWSPILEHYIAFGTFLAAFAAWFSAVKRDWKEGLPKRLSVKFWHEGKVVIQCDYAYLSGESDIRQMGQQIGAQISTDYQLKFNAANIVWKEESIIYKISDTNIKETKEITNFFKGGLPFRHYVVNYELLTKPKNFDLNRKYLWQPPFNEKLNDNEEKR